MQGEIDVKTTLDMFGFLLAGSFGLSKEMMIAETTFLMFMPWRSWQSSGNCDIPCL